MNNTKKIETFILEWKKHNFRPKKSKFLLIESFRLPDVHFLDVDPDLSWNDPRVEDSTTDLEEDIYARIITSL